MQGRGNFRCILLHLFQFLRWKIEKRTRFIGDYRCGGFPAQVEPQFSHHSTRSHGPQPGNFAIAPLLGAPVGQRPQRTPDRQRISESQYIVERIQDFRLCIERTRHTEYTKRNVYLFEPRFAVARQPLSARCHTVGRNTRALKRGLQ